MKRARYALVFTASLLLTPAAAHANSADASVPRIPEPLVFDLVRPLGAKKGQLEVNAIASVPLAKKDRAGKGDPFGSAPTSKDHRTVEWAPEIEYVPVDGFALEFELPFEGTHLEEYKLGMQWTIGTAMDGDYIHGIQALIEPTRDLRDWNSTLLYIGGMRFDDRWSGIAMAGGRMNLEGQERRESAEALLNASVFWDATEHTLFGVETNTAYHDRKHHSLMVTPQVHMEFTEHAGLQMGVGFGYSNDVRETSLVLRPIFTW